MPIVAVVDGAAGLRAAVRRGMPVGVRVRTWRNASAVDGLLRRELVDAIVLRARGRDWFGPAREWRAAFPRVPVFGYGAVRADDGRMVAAALAAGVETMLMEGVDDPVAGELVAARAASRARARELADAIRLLRLRETLQRRAWEVVLREVGSRLTTSDVARVLATSREHLSREFAAGGAPNLKRVIDLARTACAADLLRNPGCDLASCAQILRFTSPAHLAVTAHRVAGVAPGALAELGPRGVLLRFLRGRTRSRM
jgi:AraC-like DNA-binding protein